MSSLGNIGMFCDRGDNFRQVAAETSPGLFSMTILLKDKVAILCCLQNVQQAIQRLSLSCPPKMGVYNSMKNQREVETETEGE